MDAWTSPPCLTACLTQSGHAGGRGRRPGLCRAACDPGRETHGAEPAALGSPWDACVWWVRPGTAAGGGVPRPPWGWHPYTPLCPRTDLQEGSPGHTGEDRPVPGPGACPCPSPRHLAPGLPSSEPLPAQDRCKQGTGGEGQGRTSPGHALPTPIPQRRRHVHPTRALSCRGAFSEGPERVMLPLIRGPGPAEGSD